MYDPNASHVSNAITKTIFHTKYFNVSTFKNKMKQYKTENAI